MRIVKDITRLSTRLIVMSERVRQMLEEIYAVPADHIDVIPHGIPDMPFVDPNFYKDQFGVEGKKVLLTFGLLSPGKAIEHVIGALRRIVQEFPDVVYIILGATHPNLIRQQGETYRLSLERLAAELEVKRHVIFYNRFVELEELQEFLGSNGHLHYSLHTCCADYFRNSRLCIRLWQSGDVHALLARAGTVGRRARNPCSIRRQPSHRERTDCIAQRRRATARNAKTSLLARS